jgi:hypothetical protein
MTWGSLMSKFVRLTEVTGTGEIKPTLINTAHVMRAHPGSKGKDVYIRFFDGTFIFVKESIDEIERITGAGLVSQPIIMEAEQYQAYVQAKNIRDGAIAKLTTSATSLKAASLPA